MRIEQLIARTRATARIGDSNADYTDAIIRQELTDAQHSVFGALIVQAESGAWLKRYEVTTTAARARYRLPYRASAGVAGSIEILGSVGDYEVEGDQLVFDSAPATGSTLRITYYLRPSLLVPQQTQGRVASKDTANNSITLNAMPADQDVNSSTYQNQVATGHLIDVVHNNGWHELSIVGATASVGGLVITFDSAVDITDVEVGDYVRFADQTDWACLPDDFHRVLADVTAARICRARGDMQKADAIDRQVGNSDPITGDLKRFQDCLIPRVKDSYETCVPRYGVGRSFGVSRIASQDRFP
jgi:hypothetical protein